MHGQKIKDEYLRLELAVWPFVYRYRFIQIYTDLYSGKQEIGK